ncbi:hypothetical protein DFH11DRAFT_489946 [Phellopilus nigrolimitatus]|nr:hypothetical protein DFH11DRAFT_489946 [Phellopilus nigrolimitatus]
MSGTCEPHHDLWGTLLTLGLIGGLFASYIPQHYKIIGKGSSEGFSPWFLLLGATSSAAGMLNMWTMQWGVVKCCRYISTGSCLESLGGVIQVSLQWFLFAMILVLYIIYYPPHFKYTIVAIDTHDTRGVQHVKTNVKTDHWRLSVVLSWVVVIHMAFCMFMTFFLLLSTKDAPAGPAQNAQIATWATFLGLTSAALAAIQYCPQLMHTYRLKLVGALSLPMMIIQSPGAALMVISIAMRPGTDWTSWIMFAVSGIMQAILLLMCIAWKIRQQRLGIDDFGHPLSSSHSTDSAASAPLLHDANATAVDEDEGDSADRVSAVPDIEIVRAMLGEDTPLLKNGKRRDSTGKKGWGWTKAFRR